MGSLLQVKPILQFCEGKIEPFETQRTKRKERSTVLREDHFKSECPKSDMSNLTILESDALQISY